MSLWREVEEEVSVIERGCPYLASASERTSLEAGESSARKVGVRLI